MCNAMVHLRLFIFLGFVVMYNVNKCSSESQNVFLLLLSNLSESLAARMFVLISQNIHKIDPWVFV